MDPLVRFELSFPLQFLHGTLYVFLKVYFTLYYRKQEFGWISVYHFYCRVLHIGITQKFTEHDVILMV